MNIPSIPDKSYKLFIYIGLGLFIYSWIFNYQESKNYEEKRVAYNLELQKIEIQGNYIDKELEKLSQSLKNKSLNDSINELKLNSIKSKIVELNNTKNQSSLNKIELEIKDDLLEMDKLINNQSNKDNVIKTKQHLDSIKHKIKEVNNLSNLSSLKRYELENVEYWLDEINKFTFILAIVGSISFLFGIFGWFKSESFDEEIKKRANLHLPTYSNQCQSCGVKFNSMNKFGTEKNENNNYHFCLNCYKFGEFTNPNFTIEELKEKVTEKLSKQNKSEKFIEKYLKKIEELERWK